MILESSKAAIIDVQCANSHTQAVLEPHLIGGHGGVDPSSGMLLLAGRGGGVGLVRLLCVYNALSLSEVYNVIGGTGES